MRNCSPNSTFQEVCSNRSGGYGMSVFFLFLISFFPAMRTTALAKESTVSTVAGTGSAGYQDGAALTTASFLFPSGIAEDGAGNLYVTDTAAQRIRLITSKGLVRTIAGSGVASVFGLWVPGNWRDGQASAAKFDGPTGITIHGNKIYIADTGSSVIRLLTPDGFVSTYSGTPFKEGSVDGPRSSALFVHPMGLASDHMGNIYIADPGSGIRMIDASGIVHTLNIAVKVERPIGVAIHEDARGRTLFIADSLGIVRIQPSGETSRVRPQDVQGGTPMGYASAISAVDDHAVVYTDARTHTVRYLDFKADYTRVLAGQATETAAETSGSFANGPATRSFFDAPVGVLYRKNAVIVADAGNKRIRLITGFDPRSVTKVSDQIFSQCNDEKNQLRVAYVGNSFAYWDTDWETSIPGQIEHSLSNTSHMRNRTVKVNAIQLIDADLHDAADYLGLLASSHCYSTVIFSVNSVSLKGVPGLSQSTWANPAATIFRRIGKMYERAGVRFLIVLVPTHLEVGPAEGTWMRMPQAALAPNDVSDIWGLALRSSGVHYVDLWPEFISDLRSPAHRALYGSVDAHLTPHGRSLVASSVAATLRSLFGY